MPSFPDNARSSPCQQRNAVSHKFPLRSDPIGAQIIPPFSSSAVRRDLLSSRSFGRLGREDPELFSPRDCTPPIIPLPKVTGNARYQRTIYEDRIFRCLRSRFAFLYPSRSRRVSFSGFDARDTRSSEWTAERELCERKGTAVFQRRKT